MIILLLLSVLFTDVFAHGVDENTRAFLSQQEGAAFIPFLYIGAKHMVTGYDHLLFLVGVLFFLYRLKDIVLYISFFTIGHSLTLLFGVWQNIGVNAYLIDAIIALSIVYKGFDNLGGFKQLLGFQPNTKLVVFVFGLFHGFGLATKLQEFQLPTNGLFENLIAFNLGVELGQVLALSFVLILMSFWRYYRSYMLFSTTINTLLMTAGFVLFGLQMTYFFGASV